MVPASIVENAVHSDQDALPNAPPEWATLCKTLVVLVASGRERRAGKAQLHAAPDRRKARRVPGDAAVHHATSACPTCRVKSTSFPTRRGDTSATLKLAFRDRRCVKLSLATEIYCCSPETASRMEEMNKSIERRVPNWRTSLRPSKRN